MAEAVPIGIGKVHLDCDRAISYFIFYVFCRKSHSWLVKRPTNLNSIILQLCFEGQAAILAQTLAYFFLLFFFFFFFGGGGGGGEDGVGGMGFAIL